MFQMRPEGDLFVECLTTISYVGELLGRRSGGLAPLRYSQLLVSHPELRP